MIGAGCVDETDFHRSALLVGLMGEEETGLNPIKLGVIASTDTHSANPGGVRESEWGGALTGEATPEELAQLAFAAETYCALKDDYLNQRRPS